MKKLKPKFTSLAIVLAIAGTGTIRLAAHASAQSARKTGFLAYGMVGIASGQTLRLHAASVGVGHEVPVELTFLDSQGNVVARSVDKLPPERATFLDLRFAPAGTSNRVQVRGLIRWATDLGPEGYVIPTLEVIDDVTGRTAVLSADPEG